MAITWPTVLVPRRCDPTLRNFTAGGARAKTGRQQRVFSDAGFWVVPYVDFPIYTPAHTRAWNAMIARLRQGEQIIAKIFDHSTPDGGLNTDASAELSGSHAARATQATIKATGIVVALGSYFSIGNRLHIVTEVVSGSGALVHNPISDSGPWDDSLPWEDGEPPEVTYVVKFLPPFRSAYGDETAVRFDNLTLTAELESLTDGDLALDVGRWGTASMTLREAI